MRALLWVLFLVGMVGPASAQDTTRTSPIRITYLTTSAAYVDAGREDGLKAGDSIRVVRSGAEIGRLRVAYLASRQASCEILTEPGALAVGDTLDLTRSPPVSRSVAAPAVAARSAPGRIGVHQLRGRVGARYLGVWQRNGSGGYLSQPSLDLRLDGQGLGGSPIGLVVDLRTRRTLSVRTDGSSSVDGRTRAYQAALVVNSPGAPFRMTVGRQLSPSLASISLLDGALAELDHPTWGVGLFAGSEPDPISYAYSSEVADYGGYFRLHSRPGSAGQWSTTIGAIGSYEAGVANREFGYFQATVSTARFSLSATQELDYYRPWKQEVGEPPLSLSSTFAGARLSLSPTLSLNAGIDNRRNVRLYRDAVTPETTFDDTYRRGVWGGLALRVGGHGRIGMDARSSGGGPDDRTLSYTLSLSADRLSAGDLGLRSRTTRYDGPRQSGWLQSLTVGVSPASMVHLDLNGGLRVEQDPLADPTSVNVTWVGLDLDVGLARSWYLLLSGTHETGGFESNDQIYGGLTFRF